MGTRSQAPTMGQRGEPPASAGHDLLSVMLEILDRAVIATTAEGIIARWNPAAEKMLGHLAVEAIGRARLMIAAPARAEEIQAIFVRALGGEKVTEHRTQLQHKGGHLVDATLTAYPIAGARGGRSRLPRPWHKRQTQSGACRASIC